MRNSMTTILGLGVAAALASAASPASAAGDARCSALQQQVRTALTGADTNVAQATRRLRTGEALCRANNGRAAAKEFQIALKLLGATEAQQVASAGR